MKAPASFALVFSLCLAASIRAQEPGSDVPSALDPGVVLDPNALPGSIPDDAEAAAPRPAPEPPPVLDPSPTDYPVDVQGKPVDKRWKFVPFARLRGEWNDNIFIQHDHKEADFSITASPGFAFGWGDYAAEVTALGQFQGTFEPLSLDADHQSQSFIFGRYIADATFFLDNTDQNAVDHDALLAGRWEGAKLTIGARLQFQTLSGVSIDIGGRADRRVYSGEFTSDYRLGEKASIELNLRGTSTDYESQVDVDEWQAEVWMNYQVLPKTRLSAGTRLGITDFKGGSEQTYEQFVGRISYQPGAKFTLTLDGGVEWRQADTEDTGDQTFGIFNFGVAYAPFDGTSFGLSAFRRNSGAASVINETITATGVAARISQRLVQRFFLVLEGGYQDLDYNTPGGAAGRKDKNVFVKPSVSFDVTKYLTAQAAYQYQKNDSSQDERSFTENMVSVQFNVQF